MKNTILSNFPILLGQSKWGDDKNDSNNNIDVQRLIVEDHSPLRQCTKCLAFGHGRKHCEAESDLCSHCGGSHLRAQCSGYREGTSPHCNNCAMAKRQDCQHDAFSGSCSIRAKWDNIARAGTQYLC